MNLKFLKYTALLLGIVSASASFAAVRPESTRALIYVSDKEGSVPITNDSTDTAYLVQSWLVDLKGNDKNIPVILTPPLFKIEPKKQAKLRLMVVPNQLPQDRESVYWLVIQEIPPKTTAKSNELVVAVRTRMKVFIRPQGLEGKPRESVAKLNWRVESSGKENWLVAQNPTPYYISFAKLDVNSKELSDRREMVPAKGEARYRLPAGVSAGNLNVSYSAINDFGGNSAVITKSVK